HQAESQGQGAVAAACRPCDRQTAPLRSARFRAGFGLMALSSMTGFARADGVSGNYVWHWEIKSVNAKGLELRLRVPPGWDAIEPPLRARATEALARGTVHANLTVQRAGVAPVVRVNEPVLAAVLSTMRDVAKRIEAAPPAIDGILALKGVIEVLDEDESEE